jgi:hypothetical protein
MEVELHQNCLAECFLSLDILVLSHASCRCSTGGRKHGDHGDQSADAAIEEMSSLLNNNTRWAINSFVR